MRVLSVAFLVIMFSPVVSARADAKLRPFEDVTEAVELKRMNGGEHVLKAHLHGWEIPDSD